MPIEIIECDSDSSNGWKESNINKLKEAIIHPRGEKARHPRLVLSVVGDSSSFVPKPWLTPVFQLGLIETAKGAKDCVILYKGSNERISTLVGKAVDDFDVMNQQKAKKECSDEEAKKECSNDEAKKECSDDEAKQECSDEEAKKECSNDEAKKECSDEAKNLTFISLIALQPDDKEKKKTEGTEGENRRNENQTSKTADTKGTEAENRINKENQTSTRKGYKNPVVQRHFKLKDSSSDDREKMENYGMFYAEVLESVAKKYVPLVELDCNLEMIVPVVVVVAEGDLNTLDVVVKVLEKNIPVLILQGSGKAADLIAECMEE